MADDIEFWDRIAPSYAKQPVADEAAYRHKLERTRAILTPEMEVLEVGCGTGSTALAHAPFVRHVDATDLSAEMIRIGREKAKAEGIENITFDQASLADLAVAPKPYDVVMAHSLIHLLDDRDQGLAQLFQLVKPGGYLITSTACLADMSPLIRLVVPLVKLIKRMRQPVRFFSGEALVKSMEAAGFEIVETWRPSKKAALFVVSRRPG